MGSAGQPCSNGLAVKVPCSTSTTVIALFSQKNFCEKVFVVNYFCADEIERKSFYTLIILHVVGPTNHEYVIELIEKACYCEKKVHVFSSLLFHTFHSPSQHGLNVNRNYFPSNTVLCGICAGLPILCIDTL